MNALIRLLIVEDQTMLLSALAALLAMEPDIDVVATETNAEVALDRLDQRIDILVSDIELPGMSGLELARRAREKYPDLKIIMLTTFARAGYLERALKAGVSGYLLKDAQAETLADCIRKIRAGGRIIDPDLMVAACRDPDPLTDRERQCLRLAGDGLSTADIARQVHLSAGTVRNYLSEAIGKLSAANRTEAARIARQKGWL